MCQRFTDQWVVDKTLFEYLNAGSCSCCGAVHAMQDMASLITSCSDLETDDGRRERRSPWPQKMAREVWAARVKLRKVLKEDMPRYREWWETDQEAFTKWWGDITEQRKSSLLQISVDEIGAILSKRYKLQGAYAAVLCSVIEQIKHFTVTGIKGDGRTRPELEFEDILREEGGLFRVEDTGALNADVFLALCKQLGGPKLLPRREASPKGEVDDYGHLEEANEAQSFRGDRRILRLIMLRCFVDACQKAFECQRNEMTK
ncbi:unnamed protein product [Chrysoparadoxa australica]